MVLDEGIPCNLAPAHFTVHVVQVRLNFALGFVVEANPLFETGFSPGCPFFSFDFSFLSASTMRKREAGNPSRSASVLASSALLSICCVHKRRSASAAASAPGRMDFLSPRNTIVEILGFTRFSLFFNKKRSLGYDRNDETGMPLPAFCAMPPRIVISSAAEKSSLHDGFLAGWLYCLT